MKTKTVLFSLALTTVLVGVLSCTHSTAVPALSQAAGPTASQTPTSTLIFTLQPAAIPTPEEPTATPTPESASEIVPAYTETSTEETMGVPVKVEIVTDDSLPAYQFLPINKIFINPAFGKNQYGETASQAMARVVAEGLYLAW